MPLQRTIATRNYGAFGDGTFLAAMTNNEIAFVVLQFQIIGHVIIARTMMPMCEIVNERSQVSLYCNLLTWFWVGEVLPHIHPPYPFGLLQSIHG